MPLSGVRVVELCASVAGPFAAQVLADLGAEVVKVEKPEGGDDARAWGPPFWFEASATFQALNRNKQSVALDLKRPAHVEALRRYIAERADVVVQNMRPGTAERLGLGAAELTALNPRLIHCTIGAFGAQGPLKNHAGYDPLMQAFGGIMSVTGEPGRPPVRVGCSIVDLGAGMWAVIGILAALQRRHATGKGGLVDTSLFETSLTWMSVLIANYWASGELPRGHGTGLEMIVPYQGFPTASGYLIVAAANDRLFAAVARAMGHTEWADDPRFRTNADRVRHRGELIPMMERLFAAEPRERWQARLEAEGVPCAPIQDAGQVLAHPQTEALGIVQPVPGREMHRQMQLIGLPLSFEGKRPPIRSGPPAVGAHTEAILGIAPGKTSST